MTDLFSKAAAIQAVFDWEQGKISGTIADAIRAIPATDARADALREAAAVALRHRSKVQINEELWHEGQDWAAERIASAILALIDEART